MGSLLLYIAVTAATCLTPGAGVLFTVSNALRYGRSTFWASPSGNASGVAVISICCAAGLGAVITASPALFRGLQLLGALVLAYMGWKNWTAPAVAPSALRNHGGTGKDCTARRIFVGAAMLQLTNPMLFVFLLSLLPQFITPRDNYVERLSLLLAIFVFLCWAVHMGYSWLAATAAERLGGRKFAFWLNHVSALLFWALSAMVAWNLY